MIMKKEKITEEEFLARSKEQMSLKYGNQKLWIRQRWFLENPNAFNSSFFRKSFTRDSRYMQNYWELRWRKTNRVCRNDARGN